MKWIGIKNNAHLIANSKEWLSYLLTELDAANEWISIQNETITTLNTDNGSLQQQLDTAKRENERLQSDLVKVESGNIRFWKENMSLQQRLKQAIEALEYYADSECEPLIARKALSLIRKGESHGTETR